MIRKADDLLHATIKISNGNAAPPVWMMRQAGRYHRHYQALRQKYSFVELCKNPDIAAEVASGPVDAFDFDAAILFSDILFPLEALGMPLTYDPSPKLGWFIEKASDIKESFLPAEHAVQKLRFQGEAVAATRARIDQKKNLIGFVGAPWTLFCYATCGSHQNGLDQARMGLNDGRWDAFAPVISKILAANLIDQAQNGADTVAIFDTCAGDIDVTTYREHIIPVLRKTIADFKEQCAHVPVIYYSKNTKPEHWDSLETAAIDCLGIDWHHDLVGVLKKYGTQWSIQGNFDPHKLRSPTAEFSVAMNSYFDHIQAHTDVSHRKGWICGLGHGVLPQTPEENVKMFVEESRRRFVR